MSQNENIILAVAPNGARKTKADHPNIPLNSSEIAQTANDCLAAGASMMHLHVRNPKDNSHSLSAELYQQAIDAIDHKCNQEMFIQVTSEAVGIYSPEEQFDMIHALKPKAVSIGLREIESLKDNTIHEHFVRMREEDIHPQIILYNQNDLNKYHVWLERKVLPGNTYPILLVIGRPNTEGSFENSYLINENIEKLQASSWMICAFGENEFAAAKLAASLGGHIRIGFENNSVLADGSDAKDNAALINQIAHYLDDNNLQSANFTQTNEIMRPNW
ncbi:MAG: 3-keto-5-aminohexanoate cleavage enzyme [Cocleimonas sp.]|jgi:3-keto-5-aminohexanoate cleavage enzyme